jgi:hypothetical protein
MEEILSVSSFEVKGEIVVLLNLKILHLEFPIITSSSKPQHHFL